MTDKKAYFVSIEDDRFSLIYTLIAAALLFSLGVYMEVSVASRSGINFALIVIIPISCLVYFVGIILNLFCKKPLHAASVLVAPFLAFAIIVTIYGLGITPFRVLFEIASFTFHEEIKRLPSSPDAPRIKAFYWGENGGAFGTFVVTTQIIYDESGEVALPTDKRSQAWRHRMPSLLPHVLTGAQDHVRVEHIRGHYYRVDYF